MNIGMRRGRVHSQKDRTFYDSTHRKCPEDTNYIERKQIGDGLGQGGEVEGNGTQSKLVVEGDLEENTGHLKITGTGWC